jgi:selenocysteine lyase/cysteine desulfurase
VDAIVTHERAMLREFRHAIRRPDRLSWYGADRVIADRNGEGRVGLLGVNVAGFAPAEVGAILDERFDIAVRPGLHCAPYAHRHLGTFPHGTVRLSVGILTTADQMRQAAAAFDELTA